MTKPETKSADGMDFSAYLLSPTGRVEINLPNGNGDPMLHEGRRVAINVYSPASAEYARADAAMRRAAMQKITSGRKAANETEEDAELEARFLVSVTSSIENFPYPGGIEAIYRERRLKYIGDQVRAYLSDQTNFFGKSKPS